MFKILRNISITRRKRHARTLSSEESVFMKETSCQVERSFFWRVLTLSTLGLFFFSVVHRFAISATPYHNFEEINNTPEDELIFLEGGFLVKPEVWTEVGDRSDVGGVIDYVVEPSDTVSEIAQKFGVTQRTILQNNDFLDPKRIKPGTVLKIPAADGLVHIVAKDESIMSIAKKYRVDHQKILAQNELKGDSLLLEGQEIIIPGAKRKIPPKVVAVKKENSNKNVGIGSSSGIPQARETSGKLLFPTQGKYTQYFHYGHYAVDIAKSGGAPIWAAEGGKVIRSESGWNGGYGNVIVIDHGNGIKTLYAHLRERYVRVGDSVSRGTPVGYMGNTGRVYGRTGIHLHFEVTVNGAKKNPLLYF